MHRQFDGFGNITYNNNDHIYVRLPYTPVLLQTVIFVHLLAAQQAPTDGGTQGDWWARRDGLCQSTNECDQPTNVLAGFCGEASVCYVSKRFVCEKWRSGG